MPILNKDMQLCISLSARPSNIGTRFHNYLYDELGLNFVYKAFATDDIKGAVAGIRALKIRGAAVSMPFKEEIIQYLDELMPSAAAIESVNTVVNDGGYLRAYNTDFEGVVKVIKERGLDSSDSVLVRGSGGMAKAVVAAFKDQGFKNLTVIARNEKAGKSLAEKYGYEFLPDSELDSLKAYAILVNVTPLGMAGGNESDLSFPVDVIASAKAVFDVIAFPAETPLIKKAEELGVEAISGARVMTLQAAIQFELYTGVKLTDEQVERAADFSRQSS